MILEFTPMPIFVSDQRVMFDEGATACDLASLQASDNKGTSTLLETSFI